MFSVLLYFAISHSISVVALTVHVNVANMLRMQLGAVIFV